MAAWTAANPVAWPLNTIFYPALQEKDTWRGCCANVAGVCMLSCISSREWRELEAELHWNTATKNTFCFCGTSGREQFGMGLAKQQGTVTWSPSLMLVWNQDKKVPHVGKPKWTNITQNTRTFKLGQQRGDHQEDPQPHTGARRKRWVWAALCTKVQEHPSCAACCMRQQ